MYEQVKILCVDDEPNVLRSLKRLFIDDDYDIFTAPSGEDGLEVLAQEHPVQLIISDYRMPTMDGVDFLKRVCEKWPETIRIVLSGYADTAAIVAAINEGQIYKFIAKPWDDNELRVTIAKALEVYFLNLQNKQLTEELRQKNEELGRINQNLEEIVAERTNDILFQNKVLQFSQNVLHCLPIAVMGIDPEGLIVLSNRMANQIFASGGSSLTGKMIDSALPEEIYHLVRSVTGNANMSIQREIKNSIYLVNCVEIDNAKSQQGKILFLILV